jgi:hypothetical protein
VTRASHQWSDEKIRSIRTECVPVAVNGHLLDLDKDGAEGRFFRKCWPRGTENAAFMATASGKRLEHWWADWKALPESERLPGAVQVEKADLVSSTALTPSPDGLIAKVYIRGFLRGPRGDLAGENLMYLGDGRFESEPGRDHLWLTRTEWQSLVPDQPRVGDTFPVPAAVADRIIRQHLIVVPDCVTGAWSPSGVRSQRMTLTVEQASPATIRLRLEGAVLLAQPAEAEVAQTTDGYDASLRGILEYDVRKKRFTRFDIVAFGKGWESNSNRPRWNREGRRWVGIAFELADPDQPAAQGLLTAPYMLSREGNDYFGKGE